MIISRQRSFAHECFTHWGVPGCKRAVRSIYLYLFSILVSNSWKKLFALCLIHICIRLCKSIWWFRRELILFNTLLSTALKSMLCAPFWTKRSCFVLQLGIFLVYCDFEIKFSVMVVFVVDSVGLNFIKALRPQRLKPLLGLHMQSLAPVGGLSAFKHIVHVERAVTSFPYVWVYPRSLLKVHSGCLFWLHRAICPWRATHGIVWVFSCGRFAVHHILFPGKRLYVDALASILEATWSFLVELSVQPLWQLQLITLLLNDLWPFKWLYWDISLKLL